MSERRAELLALYAWCAPHVATCGECAWAWLGIFEVELGPAALADLDLVVPAAQGDVTVE